MAQWLTNPTRNHEVSGLIPGLSGLRIQRGRELWCRSDEARILHCCGSDVGQWLQLRFDP